jgi:hypothetical protein
MSLTRQFSKTLAVASNYDIPDVGLETIKSSLNYCVPTAYDCLEFAEFKAIANPATWPTFDLYGITITAQVPAEEDLVFKLYQREATDLSATATVVLSAGENFTQLVLDPVAQGLSKDNTYFMRCYSTDPEAVAQGLDLTYIVARF